MAILARVCFLLYGDFARTDAQHVFFSLATVANCIHCRERPVNPVAHLIIIIANQSGKMQWQPKYIVR
jgi:hypothetical protein